MAVPLFVSLDTQTNGDLNELLKRLRLSAVPTDSKALDLVDEALRNVRVGFVQRLGLPRVTELKAITYLEDPTDDDGHLRMIAATVEVKWCWHQLAHFLAVQFKAGGSDIMDQWNDEAPFREGVPSETQRDLIWTEIEEGLSFLSESKSLGTSGHVQASTIGPDEPATVGQTLCAPSVSQVVPS